MDPAGRVVAACRDAGAAGRALALGAEQLPYLLPPLSEVGSSLSDELGYYVHNALVTLGEATAGLGMGFVGAFVLAVLTSELPLVRRAVMPIAVVLNVTPLVAIAPALVVAFGFGPMPKLIITGLICFFPILINTATGLRSVPQQVLQVYRTMDASRVELLWHVRVPNALPYSPRCVSSFRCRSLALWWRRCRRRGLRGDWVPRSAWPPR